MKKLAYLLPLILIIVLSVSLCACNDNGKQSTEEYTVSYYDGETFVGSRLVEKGGAIPDLTMSKQDYRFVGWFLQDGSSISGVTVQGDVSVYARWSKIYNLVLNFGKGLPSQTLQAVAGQEITLPTTVDGYIGNEKILHWVSGGETYEPGSIFIMPALTVTLDAEWAELVQVTCIYENDQVTMNVAKGSKLHLLSGLVSSTGSPLYSWTDGNNIYPAGAEITVTGNMQLTAMWAGYYDLMYDVDGGEEIKSVTKYSGDEIILPLPIKTGYNFVGWQIGNSVTNAGAIYKMGASNVTIKALWDRMTFEVSFTDWDGYAFEVLTVGYGDDVIFPELAITSLPEFAGWNSDGKNILQNTVIKATYNYVTPSNAALFTFTLVDGGYAISGGNATLLTGTELVLPATYRGLPVVAVADSSSSTTGSFNGFTNVQVITLTSTYEGLGARAFRSLGNLTTVVFNNNLKYIGNDCFYDCYKLVNLPLNEGLISIGSRAFYDVGVKDFNIPASVESIGGLAFFYYPASQLNAANCYKSITVAQGSNHYASLDGVLYNKDMTELVCYPANKDGASFTLPSTVTNLGTYCFSYAKNIKTFSFGDSRVTSIAPFAFNSAEFDIVLPDTITEITSEMLNLAYGNLTLSNTIKVIPKNAFSSFYGTNVYIPANVETLEEYAFWKAPGVQNVYFASNCKVQVIPDYAFADCAKLKTVSLHEGVKEIGAYAFSITAISNPINQITTITLPASLEKIDAYAFSYCGNLQTVKFATGSKIAEIGLGAFGSCYNLKEVSFVSNDQTVDLVFQARAFVLSDHLENFQFPQNLVAIGDECFGGSDSQVYGNHSNKIEEIILPARVREIGNGAFSLAKELKSFTVASGSVLESIGSSVFYNCGKLATVVLPQSLRHIGSNVFAGCTELTHLEIKSDTMNYEFVDGGLYNTETNVLEYAKVGVDGVFTVKEGTVAIVDSCFANSQELRVINIPASLKTIGNRAFYKCFNLEEVNIPQGSTLESIGNYAFTGDPDSSPKKVIPFTNVYLPATLKSIGNQAFMCTAISTPLNFSAEFDTLGGHAFAYCPNLTSVTFAENSKLEILQANTFYQCTALTTVIFGQGSALKEMKAIVFNGCTNLTTVVITSQMVPTLGNNVFGGSTNNLSIYVPDNLLTSYINDGYWATFAKNIKPISQYNENK